MYSVLDYGRMAADPVRMDAYARAIERAVKPGSVVVDLGAGTGVFSILAARAGAKRVHAIEPNPAVWLLSELAAENGVSDRITIHQATSYEVDLPERADVIISDLRGILPLHEENLYATRDARKRFLTSGGAALPQSDRLVVALVGGESMWHWLAESWESLDAHGVTSRAARASILNAPYSDRTHPIASSDVLSDARTWTTLDYATFDSSVVEGTCALTVGREGVAHGFAVWFEATILDDIRFDTAPGSPRIYSRLFLPFLDPLPVATGDRLEVTLRADAHGTRWAWDTTTSRGRTRQATFLGAPTAPEALLRQSAAHRPTLSSHGSRVRTLLERMDGARTVQDLAHDLERELPPESPLRARALDEVREVVSRYAR
jgi:type I protein arginine methyltransferase